MFRGAYNGGLCRIWRRVGLYVTVRVYVFPHHDADAVLSLPTDRRISSRAAIGPEANLIPSKASWNSGGRDGRCFVQTANSEFSPVPSRNRLGRRRSGRRRRREGVGTRREEHGGPSLHGREFCTASAYRNLRREHRSGRRPQDTSLSPAPLASARSPVAAPPPPCSSSALLSCFASSLLLPFAITDIVLLTRFPLSFFLPESGPNWRRPRVHCALPPSSYSWEALMLDDDIHATYDFPVILKISSYSSAWIFFVNHFSRENKNNIILQTRAFVSTISLVKISSYSIFVIIYWMLDITIFYKKAKDKYYLLLWMRFFP